MRRADVIVKYVQYVITAPCSNIKAPYTNTACRNGNSTKLTSIVSSYHRQLIIRSGSRESGMRVPGTQRDNVKKPQNRVLTFTSSPVLLVTRHKHADTDRLNQTEATESERNEEAPEADVIPNWDRRGKYFNHNYNVIKKKRMWSSLHYRHSNCSSRRLYSFSFTRLDIFKKMQT